MCFKCLVPLRVRRREEEIFRRIVVVKEEGKHGR